MRRVTLHDTWKKFFTTIVLGEFGTNIECFYRLYRFFAVVCEDFFSVFVLILDNDVVYMKKNNKFAHWAKSIDNFFN